MEWNLLLNFFYQLGFQVSSALQKGLGDSFGNYLLFGIAEVEEPRAIPWWPNTLAWKVLAGLLFAWLLSLAFRYIRVWRSNQYRREALKKLASLKASKADQKNYLRQFSVLLKMTALQAYPRTEVAQLSGLEWLEMLDSKWNETTFVSEIGERLLTISYQDEKHWQLSQAQVDELTSAIERWIVRHRSADRELRHV